MNTILIVPEELKSIDKYQIYNRKKMRFTVYSKDGCPYCSKIEQVLTLSKLEHKIYKLGEHFTRDEFYAEFGQGSTFPQVLMNDQEHLGGCTDTVKYLQENKII
jgi:glutaredoxin